MRRSILAVALIGLTLSGCASPPAETPTTPSVTPSSTPSAEVIPSAPTLSELVLSVDGFRSFDAAGEEQRTFGWGSDDALLAIDYLTEVTGLTPTTEPYDGGYNDVDGTTYSWGGVELQYSHGVEGEEPRGFRLRFIAASVGPLVLRTQSGITAGSSIAEVEAAGGHPISLSGADVLYGLDEVTLAEVPGQGDPEVLSVGAFTSGSGLIDWVGAPYSSYSP